jgi:hypothetical protein
VHPSICRHGVRQVKGLDMREQDIFGMSRDRGMFHAGRIMLHGAGLVYETTRTVLQWGCAHCPSTSMTT